jgi:AraC-like DNA-binding protein
MNYAEIAPSKHLAKYIKCFWTLEQAGPLSDHAPEPVMPDGSLEIIFNLSDPFRRYHHDGAIETQSSAIVAGQMREFAVIEPSGSVRLFGIRFHPAGAYPFFKFPLSELTDRIEDLDLIWGKQAREIEEKINCAKTREECVAAAESVLYKLLAANANYDPIVEHASEMIVENRGLATIETITDNLGVSGRRLERRFQQRFGLTPKFFSRIIRFQHLLAALQEERKENLLGTALSFGYYDQAHLIHEFREFSGKSPAAFFENEYQFSQFFISADKQAGN